MSAKIPYAVKISNTDLRTFISKKYMCQCGEVTYNDGGVCDTCKVENEWRSD
jgi:hypothetical protein